MFPSSQQLVYYHQEDGIPRQPEGGNDCAIYVMIMADLLCDRLPFVIKPEDMSFLRAVTFYRMMKKTLGYPHQSLRVLVND